MGIRKLELLGSHYFYGYRKLFYSLPLGSRSTPCRMESYGRRQYEYLSRCPICNYRADIGALVNYYLARWLGRPIIYKFANSRLGHMCLIDEEKIHHAEEYFRKHGAASTFFGRLIPAVRQLISIPAGLAGMKIGPFLLYTTLGAAIWNSILALLGYLIYRFTDLKTINDVYVMATEYSHEIGYVIIAVVVIVIVFLAYKGLKKRK